MHMKNPQNLWANQVFSLLTVPGNALVKGGKIPKNP